jgi:hypothetical protein
MLLLERTVRAVVQNVVQASFVTHQVLLSVSHALLVSTALTALVHVRTLMLVSKVRRLRAALCMWRQALRIKWLVLLVSTALTALANVRTLLPASKASSSVPARCMHRLVQNFKWLAWLVNLSLMVMQRARMSLLAKLVAPPMLPRRVLQTPSIRRAPRSRWDALQVHTGLQTTMLPIASTFLRVRLV